MKKHRFNPRFWYSVAALPITSIPLEENKSKSNLSQKPRVTSGTGLRRSTSAYDLASSNTPKSFPSLPQARRETAIEED
jgi:hypothetical protein